jgi:hypothetical protein
MYRSLIACGLTLLVAGCPGDDDDDGDDVQGHPTPNAFELLADDYEPGALLSLWASGANDVWAVGGEFGEPVVLQFDGTSWTRNDPPVAQQLWWVHGFAGGPVFVVGEGGAIAKWDGSWELMESGHPNTTFFGVWGAAPNDVWAVGGPVPTSTNTAVDGDVVLHYDGSSWTRRSVPDLESKPASALRNLFKVWGTSADDVIIVGDRGETLHYDGTTFRLKESAAGSGTSLFTAWGRSANDVYAIGDELGSVKLIHYDGSAWSPVDLPSDAPQVAQGVWTAPGQPLYIAGYDGYIACLGADGTWTSFDPVTTRAFHVVMGDGAGNVWAAGGNIQSRMPDYKGVLVVSGRDVPAVP